MRKYYRYDAYIAAEVNADGVVQVVDSTWNKNTILADNLEMEDAIEKAQNLWLDKYMPDSMYDDVGREYYIDKNGVIHWTNQEG